MEKNVNEILLQEDASAKSLVSFLEERSDELSLADSYLYHNFPLYKEEDDSSSRANILIISPQYGVIVFECTDVSSRVEGGLFNPIQKQLDDLEQTFSQIYSKLIRSKVLRRSPREIKIQVVPVVYAPNVDTDKVAWAEDSEFIFKIFGQEFIAEFLQEVHLDKEVDELIIRETLAVVEGSKGICKPKTRNLKESLAKSKGAIVQEIELEINNFDREQKRAALNIIDGPQRIRGLAGSGKTIILTWKAALLHLQDENADIVYTFYTKSLYEFIKRLITRFYRQYAEKDPNWNKIHILHAWGGKTLPGVYYKACIDNDTPPRTFAEAQAMGENAFEAVCAELVERDLNSRYDYVIMDEAQDFPSSFYRLCLKLTKDKKLIWGYDECQNILDIEIQNTKKTFGKGPDGGYLVDLDAAPPGVRNDIVLHRCYRNPREIIIYAFALGLGLYNDRILQMPENNEHWRDLGFRVVEGESRTGDHMVIERPEENTPLIMNKLFRESCIKVTAFDDFDAECEGVAKNIKADIDAELLPEDILVISLDDRYAKGYFQKIELHLQSYGIQCFNLQTAPSVNTMFSVPNNVTLSTVYKAKGNESASVHVVGIDSAYYYKDLISSRNKIFTALTRAKGWIHITGTGKSADSFKKEFQRVTEAYPVFDFIMPDRGDMKMFQRDLSESQAELSEVERMIEALAKKRNVPVDKILTEIAKDKSKSQSKSSKK